jgi:hypothetical protein
LAPNYNSELYAEANKNEDLRRKEQKIVFNVKELLNVGVDLTLWRRSEKKQPRRNERQIWLI